MTRAPSIPYRSMRRSILAGAIALLAGGFIAPLSAQAAFPDKPVRMIVPFGPGTTTDTVARVVADGMSKALGQTVVVENKAGAGGTIGTSQVARSTADGYTILMGTVGTHAINKALYSDPGYDPETDFEPIAFPGYTPTFLVVKGDAPYQSVKELGEAAKKSGQVAFSSAGNGTSGHLAGELLKDRLGAPMLHVPYKEGGMALSDVMSGQVQFMFYHPAAVMPHIRAGKLRALGVSSAKPSQAAPDVRPIAEQTGSDFDLVAWFMLYAPAGTPEPAMDKLKSAAQSALTDTQIVEKLNSLGLENPGDTSINLSEFGKAEIGKWADLVTRAGAKVQ